MSCAKTPTGGKHEVAATEVEAVALALEKVDEDLAEFDDVEEEEAEAGGDPDWVEEERKLKEENKKRQMENRKKNNKMGMKEKVELLDNLLQKAAAYTAFLRERMKVCPLFLSCLACFLYGQPRPTCGRCRQPLPPSSAKFMEGILFVLISVCFRPAISFLFDSFLFELCVL